MATLESAVPILCVANARTAEAFYCGKLGFTVRAAHRPDPAKDDPCYMTLARDAVALHVHSFPGFAGMSAVYINVDDVNALHAELQARGVEIAHPPIDQEWGTREIALRDPDQNVLTFGQRSR